MLTYQTAYFHACSLLAPLAYMHAQQVNDIATKFNVASPAHLHNTCAVVAAVSPLSLHLLAMVAASSAKMLSHNPSLPVTTMSPGCSSNSKRCNDNTHIPHESADASNATLQHPASKKHKVPTWLHIVHHVQQCTAGVQTLIGRPVASCLNDTIANAHHGCLWLITHGVG